MVATRTPADDALAEVKHYRELVRYHADQVRQGIAACNRPHTIKHQTELRRYRERLRDAQLRVQGFGGRE